MSSGSGDRGVWVSVNGKQSTEILVERTWNIDRMKKHMFRAASIDQIGDIIIFRHKDDYNKHREAHLFAKVMIKQNNRKLRTNTNQRQT